MSIDLLALAARAVVDLRASAARGFVPDGTIQDPLACSALSAVSDDTVIAVVLRVLDLVEETKQDYRDQIAVAGIPEADYLAVTGQPLPDAADAQAWLDAYDSIDIVPLFQACPGVTLPGLPAAAKCVGHQYEFVMDGNPGSNWKEMRPSSHKLSGTAHTVAATATLTTMTFACSGAHGGTEVRVLIDGSPTGSFSFTAQNEVATIDVDVDAGEALGVEARKLGGTAAEDIIVVVS